jgi:CRP-like cAMP-binding protein
MPGGMPELRLKRLALFKKVDEKVLATLERHIQERLYPSNEVVYRTGSPCDGLYAVLKGGVLVRTERPGQPVDRFLDLGPGEVFGELEAVEEAPREHTARTVRVAHLLWIPAPPLRDTLAVHPFLGTILRTLAVRRKTVQTRVRVAASTRREPRIWVDRDVVLKLEHEKPVAVRLADLSFRGACLAAVPPSWRTGQRISFVLGTEEHPDLLQVRGLVRWHEPGTVGVIFENDGPHLRQKVERALRVLVS